MSKRRVIAKIIKTVGNVQDIYLVFITDIIINTYYEITLNKNLMDGC